MLLPLEFVSFFFFLPLLVLSCMGFAIFFIIVVSFCCKLVEEQCLESTLCIANVIHIDVYIIIFNAFCLNKILSGSWLSCPKFLIVLKLYFPLCDTWGVS